MTRSAWWLTCDALAVYRLAVLVTKDTITEPAREWLRRRCMQTFHLKHDGETAGRLAQTVAANIEVGMMTAPSGAWRWLFELAGCPWCVSVWAAAPVVALTKFAPGVWQYPAMGLALTAAAGILSSVS